MKKIIGIIYSGFLLVLLASPQLQAMRQRQEIYVYIAQEAIKNLGLEEKDKGPYLVTLSQNTTAQDVLEEVALSTKAFYMPAYGPEEGFHAYGERLADAYNQGLLSLWAVYKKGESLAPLTPRRKLESDDLIRDFLADYGNEFLIRYNK